MFSDLIFFLFKRERENILLDTNNKGSLFEIRNKIGFFLNTCSEKQGELETVTTYNKKSNNPSSELLAFNE